jgi:DNA-directed RNA polymerase specialized sigma24 family protein
MGQSQNPTGFDEPGVRALLAGDEEDVGRALACLDRHLRIPMSRWLLRRFPGLTPDDLADTWAETLLCVLQAARQRRFQPDRPLLPWLCHLARARAIDLTRRRSSRDAALASLGQRLASARLWWRTLPARVTGEEIMSLIQSQVGALPPRQRLVLEVFIEHYPERASLAVLRQEVSRRTGKEESLVAVKRALQEGRLRVREFLLREGYDPAMLGLP